MLIQSSWWPKLYLPQISLNLWGVWVLTHILLLHLTRVPPADTMIQLLFSFRLHLFLYPSHLCHVLCNKLPPTAYLWEQGVQNSIHLWTSLFGNHVEKEVLWDLCIMMSKFQTKLQHYFFTSNNKSNFHSFAAARFSVRNADDSWAFMASLFHKSCGQATYQWGGAHTASVWRCKTSFVGQNAGLSVPRSPGRFQQRHQKLRRRSQNLHLST